MIMLSEEAFERLFEQMRQLREQSKQLQEDSSKEEYAIPVSMLRQLFLLLGRAESSPAIWTSGVLQRVRELQTYVEERYNTAFEEWT